MGFWSGDSPSISYKQSPQQRQVWDTIFPALQNFFQGGYQNPYDIPSPVMPTTDWYNNIAPEVRQSLWEPAIEGGNQLAEVLGAKGQYGGASTPASGSGATALGKLFADYSQGIGQQAWNMTAPGLTADYNAQLQRNMTAGLLPFQTAASMLPGTYASPVVNPGQQGFLDLAAGKALDFLAPTLSDFGGGSGIASSLQQQTPTYGSSLNSVPMGSGYTSSFGQTQPWSQFYGYGAGAQTSPWSMSSFASFF